MSRHGNICRKQHAIVIPWILVLNISIAGLMLNLLRSLNQKDSSQFFLSPPAHQSRFKPESVRRRKSIVLRSALGSNNNNNKRADSAWAGWIPEGKCSFRLYISCKIGSWKESQDCWRSMTGPILCSRRGRRHYHRHISYLPLCYPEPSRPKRFTRGRGEVGDPSPRPELDTAEDIGSTMQIGEDLCKKEVGSVSCKERKEVVH